MPGGRRIPHMDDQRHGRDEGAAPTPRARWPRAAAGAAAGVVAGFAALAVAEPVAAAVRPQSSPVAVVGGAVIDATPAAVKDFAVRHFGTGDKPVLEGGILVILALFAVALGLLSLRLRRTAAAGVLVFGAVG